MSSDANAHVSLDKYERRGSLDSVDRGRDKCGKRAKFAHFKKSHALKSLVFVWLCAIHVVGIFFFTRGFLLTKLILEDRSTCENGPIGKWGALQPNSSEDGCWYPRKFRKAVVIVIDALRYDFTVPFASSENDPQQCHGAFPVLYDYAKSRPENAFLLPFIADPPTTTLQRLKGLTTGTLPTFIDAGSNFAGTAVEEDNLLTQMRSQGRTLVHLGDDTWQSLFPDFFDGNLSHAYDSFNVWDLHTVDDGVITHLMPLLQDQKSKWDFIFSHFLGVDHAGHRYGPNHPAMRDKLRQMNEVVTEIIEALDEETLLVVMGDHGMDTKGDHGGESDEEVEAALWMYSTRPAFGRTRSEFFTPPATAKIRPVRQTDLASTLSLLLGLPIPFNNIGAPIEEAFSEPGGPNWSALATANDITFAQIQRYQDKYSQARDLNFDGFDHRDLEQPAIPPMNPQDPASEQDESHFMEAYHSLRRRQAAVLTLYRRLWADFNIGQMSMGVILLMGGFACLLVIYASISALEPIYLAKYICVGVGAGFCVSVISDALVTRQLRPTIALFGSAVAGSMAAFSSIVLCPGNLQALVPNNVWSWLATMFTASQAAGFASNSYTIHEDSVLLFFLSSFGLICCASSLRQRDASDRYLGITHSVLFTLLTRWVSFSRLCREEQMPGCRSTFYASSNSSTSAPWQILVPFLIALLLPAFVKARYANTASYTRPAHFWLVLCFRVGLLLVAAYWVLDAADNGGWVQDSVSGETLKRATLALSRCVIGIALGVGTITIVWAKPCVDISVARQKVSEGQPEEVERQAEPNIAILGYANLHGTRYFLILPGMILLTCLLLPPTGQFSIATCACQILCLLEILDANGLIIAPPSRPHRDRTKMSSSSTSVGPIVLALLGSYHFFKTGHQASLASIQWNAAFVPLRTIVYPWSPVLVVINTFGAQILCALAVPLTVLWKRPPLDAEVGEEKSGNLDMDRFPIEREVRNGNDVDPQYSSMKTRWGEALMRDVMKALLAHMSYYATIQLATTLWAGHLRRHLMLYRVFMPRFLMATALLLVIDLVILLGSWTMFRIEALSVAELLW